MRRLALGPTMVASSAAGKEEQAAKLAGAARTRVGDQLDLIEKDAFRFCWIIDFPFYEWDEDEKKVDFAHNPFSMPQGGLDALNNQDPLTIKAYQYDMVCNGYELASGSIRNQHPDLMVKAFELVGLSKADVEERFGGMYRAFQYGAPPHGGMAAGVDRMVMLLCGVQNLREITLFPMNQRAEDLLMGAPSPATMKQLRELDLRHCGAAKGLTGPTEHRFAAANGELCWFECGYPADHRPTLLLLHATGFHARCWDATIAALPTDWHIIALDLRGHGRSYRPASLSDWLVTADDVVDFVQATCASPVFAVGHSMGGYVAARTAALALENIAGLLLVDPVMMPREFYGDVPQNLDAELADHPVARRRSRWESADQMNRAFFSTLALRSVAP